MKTQEIILASKSPRRIELLRLLGLNFKVHPSNFDESVLLYLPPKDFALEAAKQKALSIAEEYPNSIIISADTVVTLDSKIFGKPSSNNEAREFLKTLRGKTHSVITGIAILYLSYSKEPLCDAVETYVKMKNFSDKKLEEYIKTGEPFDKAGAYGIQGHGGELIESIDGCYFNVVGLPIRRLLDILNLFFDTSHYISKIPIEFKLY